MAIPRIGDANADKIKQELANAQAKAQEILSQANVQANKFIEEARQSAAKVLEQETQKAIATANDIIAKARQASEAELARMKNELRKEVGRLVVNTTAKVTGKVLSADDQNRLAEETNGTLALCGLSAEVQRLFDLGNFTELFVIYASREEGVTKLA